MLSTSRNRWSMNRPPRTQQKKRIPCFPPTSAERTQTMYRKVDKLSHMPLDALYEICRWLSPNDLLQLVRTSKLLRRILTNRASITIWRFSLSSIPGLPTCWPGMSEPAYAELVYGRTCQACSAPRIISGGWWFGTRLCASCAKIHATSGIQSILQNQELRLREYIRSESVKYRIRCQRPLLGDFFRHQFNLRESRVSIPNTQNPRSTCTSSCASTRSKGRPLNDANMGEGPSNT